MRPFFSLVRRSDPEKTSSQHKRNKRKTVDLTDKTRQKEKGTLVPKKKTRYSLSMGI